MIVSGFFTPCAIILLRAQEMCVPGLQERLFPGCTCWFITCKYLSAGFVTWGSYEPVKLESEWLYTTETQSRTPAYVNQCSSFESDGAGSIYSRWEALETGDIAPQWPVIRHHPVLSLFKCDSTASLQMIACYATCWPFTDSNGHWCLSHALHEVRGKKPQQDLGTALISSEPCSGYRECCRGCACLLCVGMNSSLWFPGGTGSCPLLWL